MDIERIYPHLVASHGCQAIDGLCHLALLQAHRDHHNPLLVDVLPDHVENDLRSGLSNGLYNMADGR